jgi:uncharacterized protein YlxP (DUF503 family)
VGYQDLWQRSKVLMVIAASDLRVLDGTMERMRQYLDGQEWVLVSCEVEVVDVDA